MTFNEIVWKMAKVHYKKYILYFLCNSFAVLFFFMFATVYFNEHVEEVKQSESIQSVLGVPAAALIVFTVFFINYAHHIFIKRRKSEFGLFMTLGMTNRDIGRLVVLENLIISIFSMATGIVAGMIFSRLFFLLLMNSVGMHDISFHLNSRMFFYAIITYGIIQTFVVGKSLYLILKDNLIQSLKSDKVAETIKFKSPMLGGIGLAMIVGSVGGLYMTYGLNAIDGGIYLLLWAIVTFVGLYLCLSQFTSFFIEVAKKDSAFYYRGLLFLSSIQYKFKRLTSILMLVTVMIMITILYGTIILSTYILEEREVMANNPFDLAYIQTETKNNLPEDELYSIFEDNPIQQRVEIPIYSYYEKTYDNLYKEYHIISPESFKELTSQDVKLQGREFVYYVNVQQEFMGDRDAYEDELIFPTKDGEIAFERKEFVVERTMNYQLGLHDFIVVSEDEVEFLKKYVIGFEANIHLMNVADWEESATAVKDLENRFMNFNKSTPPIADARVEFTTEENLFQVGSKVGDTNRNRSSNGMLFFIMSFLSIIFFFGAFILLYLNLFSEIDKEKTKYKKLYNVGVTSKEVKRMISQEVAAIFFVPTFIGTGLALLYIVAMANDIGGIKENPELLLQFFIIAGFYHIIQISFYLYARRKMFVYLVER
ncbi:ABC transporter permease [Lysinibacillus sp. 54212]|uniref:ABC transporter permease n=1 Tax=Lysinibacillus sp. 54212 TaxID=3119829 RepID=UPI002FCA82B1